MADQTNQNDLLPFACCDHCECLSSERFGHDDTCRICQNPDGSPATSSASGITEEAHRG